MIELAPDHKRGLGVANPVMLAVGTVGMGDAVHPNLDLAAVGAVVVGPLTRASRGGSEAPRIAEVAGGMVLDTGLQNRGLDATMRHSAEAWARMPVPVLVHIAENDPRRLGEMTRRLSELENVAGIELGFPSRFDLNWIRIAIQSLTDEGDLPVLARLPLARASEIAKPVVEAGASALVIGGPPRAAAFSGDVLVQGELFGLAVFPQMLGALVDVAALRLGVPLVASGGIHTERQARQALEAGASAVQLDTIAWLEPERVNLIAGALGG